MTTSGENENGRDKKQIAFAITVLTLLVVLQTPLPVLLLRNFISADDADNLTSSLRASVPGIIVALLVAFTYERAKDKAFTTDLSELKRSLGEARQEIADERITLANEILSHRDPADLVKFGLERVYGANGHIESLMSAIISDRHIYRDVDCFHYLSDTPGGDAWKVETTYRVTVHDLPVYLTALTIGNSSAAHLAAECPKLIQILSYEDDMGIARAVDSLKSSHDSVRFMVSTDDGANRSVVSSRMEEVPEDEYEGYGVPLTGPFGEPVKLMRNIIPNGANNQVTVTTRSIGEIPRDTRFCYYWEDRPAYVRRVIFDWSRMTFSADSPPNHRVVPFFIPRGTTPVVDSSTNRIEIAVEQWLTPGQGVVLLW
ncbi:hypothetical protein [Streptomyces sp. NPDC054834]